MSENAGFIDGNTARARSAFEGIGALIAAALPAKVNLHVPKVVGLVMTKLEGIRKLRPQIEEHLPTFDRARLERLETLALALFYAQGAYLVASKPKNSMEQLGARGFKLRRILMADAATQVIREIFPEEVLVKLREGSGYRDLGEDLIALVHLYRGNWAQVEETTGISERELEEAEALSPVLVVGAENRVLTSGSRGKAAEDRARVFGLLVEAYNDARRAALYLCPTEEDADEIAPSLYAGRGGRPEEDEEVEELPPDEASSDALPGDEPATAGTAATSGSSQANTATTDGSGGVARSEWAKPGMPGSNPFTE